MFRRLLAIYVSLSLAALPFTQALAEANQSQAIEDARALKQQAEDYFQNHTLMPEEGVLHFSSGVNNSLSGATGSIDVQALFPGDAGGKTQSDFEGLYGKDDQIAAEAAKRQLEATSEASPAGEAYRMFDAGLKSNPRPDLTHDPIFATWDWMHQFVDTKTPLCQQAGSHTPKLVTCRRPTTHPKRCSGHRLVSVFHRNVEVFLGGRIPSHGVIRAQLNFTSGTYAILPGNQASPHAGTVPKLDFEEICQSQSPHIVFAGSDPWYPEIPGEHDPTYELTVEQAPSCENGLTAIVRIQDIKSGSSTIVQGAQMIWDMYGISEDDWVWDKDSCPADIAAIESGTCAGTVQCSANPTECITADGLSFCGDELEPPPANVPRGCRAISVEKRCGGAMTQDDECAALEKPSQDNPYGCAFLSSRCVQYGEDGTCLATEDTYDCGVIPGADAACQASLALQDMVQDCQVTATPSKVRRTVHHPKLVTCEILKRLTKCKAERDLGIAHPSGTLSFTRDCFISDTITFKPSWTDDVTLLGATYGWTQAGLSIAPPCGENTRYQALTSHNII